MRSTTPRGGGASHILKVREIHPLIALDCAFYYKTMIRLCVLDLVTIFIVCPFLPSFVRIHGFPIPDYTAFIELIRNIRLSTKRMIFAVILYLADVSFFVI